jgi:hypothetical protein
MQFLLVVIEINITKRTIFGEKFRLLFKHYTCQQTEKVSMSEMAHFNKKKPIPEDDKTKSVLFEDLDSIQNSEDFLDFPFKNSKNHHQERGEMNEQDKNR